MVEIFQVKLTDNCRFTVITDHNKITESQYTSVIYRLYSFRIVSTLSETYTGNVDLNME